MDWIKCWFYYPIAFLTLTAIIFTTGVHDFLAKYQGQTGCTPQNARGRRRKMSYKEEHLP